MLWGVFENPWEHVGIGTVASAVTSGVWLYFYKRRFDLKDREQKIAEAQVVIEKWKEYADAVKDHADTQLDLMRGELQDVERRLRDCEGDRDSLHRAKRKLQNRIGVLEGKLGVEPPEDDEDSDK